MVSIALLSVCATSHRLLLALNSDYIGNDTTNISSFLTFNSTCSYIKFAVTFSSSEM